MCPYASPEAALPVVAKGGKSVRHDGSSTKSDDSVPSNTSPGDEARWTRGPGVSPVRGMVVVDHSKSSRRHETTSSTSIINTPINNNLLLAHYVRRLQVYEVSVKEWIFTTDRPFRPHSHILENFKRPYLSNASSVVFCSRVGFSGTADRMTLFSVGSNTRWRLAAILKNSNGHTM